MLSWVDQVYRKVERDTFTGNAFVAGKTKRLFFCNNFVIIHVCYALRAFDVGQSTALIT